MTESSAAGHPANRLSRGECTTFEDAVTTLLAAFREEHDRFPALDSRAFWTAAIADAEEALRLYQMRGSVSEVDLFDRLAASDRRTMREIGQAAIAGDYSILGF